MIADKLSSASGYRPTSAFVVIGIVFVAVAFRVASAPVLEDRSAPGEARREADPLSAFDIEDRAGRTLARFLEHYDLVMSPRSMWQSHTPALMARALSLACGGSPRPAELLARMLPGAQGGVIRAAGLPLSARQAAAVRAWLAEERVRGVRVEPDPSRGAYVIAWEPLVLLSPEERAAHGHKRMAAWWQNFHRGLIEQLFPEEFAALWKDQQAWVARRTKVWNQLMPSGYVVLLRDLAPQTVLALDGLMRREGVNPLQLKIASRRQRAYPGEHWAILGDWGWLPGQKPGEQEARSGLERLCDGLLERPEWSWIERRPAFYEYMRDKAAGHAARPYFVQSREGSLVPRVRTTLDIDLQRSVHERLLELLHKHLGAVAMAIALDLESGDVLAVDGVSRHRNANFLPIFQRFTPGSTFKVLTMAVALESGAVRPDDSFDVGNGTWTLRLPGRPARVIHEADGSLAQGRVTAAQCLAYSSNAGMTQVGISVEGDYFHQKLQQLHYGSKPGSGLGPESSGLLYKLPWDKRNDQASVSFGHQIEVTLWQHAAALATVLRGGRWRPLRLLDRVSQDGAGRPVAPVPFDPARDQVFSAATSRELRTMMELGAREGTGRPVCAQRTDLVLASKTGTAQKLAMEMCQHAYGQAIDRAAQAGRGLTKAEYQALRGSGPAHAGSCYTASMCLLGSLPGSGREVLVLVVVDEPTQGGHFGSSVAGPVALAILDEALGVTRGGQRALAAIAGGFSPDCDLSGETRWEQPWREALR